MIKFTFLLFALIITSQVGYSQDEKSLQYALEGKRVTVLIEMPASQEGINIDLDEQRPMDFGEYSRRIKQYGIAIKPNDQVLITKITKKKKHIEFQLAGGGYGTFGDESGHVPSVQIPVSLKEEEIKKQLGDTKISKERKTELQSSLDELKRQRLIQQQQNDQQAALQSSLNRNAIQEKRRSGGSRFNIRLNRNVEDRDLTVEFLRNALSEYVDFNNINNSTTVMSPISASGLSKGISLDEMVKIFGLPKSLVSSNECNIEITTCSFEKGDQLIKAIFAEKILVKYAIESR